MTQYLAVIMIKYPSQIPLTKRAVGKREKRREVGRRERNVYTNQGK
jgi:hypothetical protein